MGNLLCLPQKVFELFVSKCHVFCARLKQMTLGQLRIKKNVDVEFVLSVYKNDNKTLFKLWEVIVWV